ncbi:MAG: hypothetical protein LBT89_01230 [Planctomycetaceae bacterium]|jgi:hypothetical protein|nr:hypothetical protein [Planctomycetaceae bacterium]
MKSHFLLSALAVAVIFAATSTVEAGLFGRLSVVCSPCEPTACQPCEEAAIAPCDAACDPCGDVCGRPFLPFGGFFLNLKAKLATLKACTPCDVAACDPCEAAACDPCEAACEPVCVGPILPFNGFFLNLKARLAAGLHPCTISECTPCEPACDPCNPCK